MAFYHSDDARAMAAMSKMNGTSPYANSTSVPMPPPARVQRTLKWSWGSTIFASLGTCICCSICSTLGLLLSALSYADYKTGDYDRSKRKRRWSWICTAIAFVIGVTITAFVITLVAVFAEDTEGWWTDIKDWVKEKMCDAGFKDQCKTTR